MLEKISKHFFLFLIFEVDSSQILTVNFMKISKILVTLTSAENVNNLQHNLIFPLYTTLIFCFDDKEKKEKSECTASGGGGVLAC